MKSNRTYLHPKAFHQKDSNTKSFPELPVERFDHRIGLTSLQVHKTVLSKDGRLWAATPAGLACYDGVKARVYGRKDGLANHGLRTLAIHPNTGELWIGTDLGVEILNISHGKPQPLWSNPLGTVNALGLQEKSVLIGSSLGLFTGLGKQSFTKLKGFRESDDTIEKIFAHPDGSYWIIGSTFGLIHLAKNFIKIPLEPLQKYLGKASVITEGPNATVLVGGSEGFCQVTSNGSVKSFRRLSAPVEALYWDRDKIWLSFNQSVCSVSADLSQRAEPNIHLQSIVVKHILSDRFDNIWLSTSGKALLKISNFRNTFVDDFPTKTGHVLSIFSNQSGRFIGGSSGLVLPNGSVILKNLEIWDVLREEIGKIWCATDKGLFCTPNPQLSFQYQVENCPVIQAPCRALKIFNHRLYIGSIRGLARLSHNGAEEIFCPDSKSFGYVYSLHTGPDKHLWIATLGQGVFRFDGQTVSRVNLPDDASNANVYAITHDNSGRIYLAHDNKISRRNLDGTYQILFESTLTVAAWSLGWMEGGNLVAGSTAGLIIFNDETGQVKHRISGNFEDVPWEFTTSRSLAIQDHKTLFCGLGSGLRTVILNDLIPRNEAPVARLAQTKCSGTELKKHDDVYRIESGKWRLVIEISTEWFLDNCQMRYRLMGFDKNWSDNLPVGPIHYTSLPIGHYTLEVGLISPLAGAGPVAKLIQIEVTPAQKA